ncbi:ThuA domain-containing protein [Planctomonas psychrotolerans]|uniref:ThuA domain-containing protein n=1 Tax=Planctomonas psychrotolerans TaxID=2528712 RepID=UPI00123A281F|nr:ThuA domain-containing protein [Planctomonas psychrotolerans]
MTSIIIFSGTVGFRHDSLEAGVRAAEQLGADAGVEVVATEDARIFTSSDLAEAAAVVWMQASGTGLLDADQRAAYERFTADGGGFAGVHAASDAERDWPLFSQLVGARFREHPAELQTAPIQVERPDDASMKSVPEPWLWNEEWYAFESNPRDSVEVLATISEDTYAPGSASMGVDHPLVWRTRVGAARGWYTSLGHSAEAFDDATFRQHLWGGISSVLNDNNHTRRNK